MKISAGRCPSEPTTLLERTRRGDMLPYRARCAAVLSCGAGVLLVSPPRNGYSQFVGHRSVRIEHNKMTELVGTFTNVRI